MAGTGNKINGISLRKVFAIAALNVAIIAGATKLVVHGRQQRHSILVAVPGISGFPMANRAPVLATATPLCVASAERAGPGNGLKRNSCHETQQEH
jgi:hypothetical protein